MAWSNIAARILRLASWWIGRFSRWYWGHCWSLWRRRIRFHIWSLENVATPEQKSERTTRCLSCKSLERQNDAWWLTCHYSFQKLPWADKKPGKKPSKTLARKTRWLRLIAKELYLKSAPPTWLIPQSLQWTAWCTWLPPRRRTFGRLQWTFARGCRPRDLKAGKSSISYWGHVPIWARKLLISLNSIFPIQQYRTNLLS